MATILELYERFYQISVSTENSHLRTSVHSVFFSSCVKPLGLHHGHSIHSNDNLLSLSLSRRILLSSLTHSINTRNHLLINSFCKTLARHKYRYQIHLAAFKMNQIRRDQHIYGISLRSNTDAGLKLYSFPTSSDKGFHTNLSLPFIRTIHNSDIILALLYYPDFYWNNFN